MAITEKIVGGCYNGPQSEGDVVYYTIETRLRSEPFAFWLPDWELGGFHFCCSSKAAAEAAAVKAATGMFGFYTLSYARKAIKRAMKKDTDLYYVFRIVKVKLHKTVQVIDTPEGR